MNPYSRHNSRPLDANLNKLQNFYRQQLESQIPSNPQGRTPSERPYPTSGDDSGPDNVYVNVIFDNTQGAVAKRAVTTTTTTVPIINKPDDYYCSIVRFDVPLSQIPLFICPIIPNQPDPDRTPFIIGIDYLGTKYPVELHYISYNQELQPVQNTPDMVVTAYYYMYSIQQFLDITNVALKTAMVNSGFNMAGLNYPYFYWDPTTELVHLVYPSAIITPTNKPLIFMNTALQQWIDGFSLTYRGVQTQGNDFYFNLYNTLLPVPPYPGAEDLFVPTTGYPVTYPAGASGASGPVGQIGATGAECPCSGASGPSVPYYFDIKQEYKSLNNQVALKKIYITSTGLPTIPEFTPGSQTASSSTLPILTDFVPNVNNLSDAKSVAYYFPQSQYRLIDMISSTPIQSFDLQILWVDQFNGIHTVYVPPRSQANVKLIFAKRTLFKSLK